MIYETGPIGRYYFPSRVYIPWSEVRVKLFIKYGGTGDAYISQKNMLRSDIQMNGIVQHARIGGPSTCYWNMKLEVAGDRQTTILRTCIEAPLNSASMPNTDRLMNWLEREKKGDGGQWMGLGRGPYCLATLRVNLSFPLPLFKM